MFGAKLVGNWDNAKKMLDAAPAAFDRALKKTVQAEAEKIAGMIRKRIASNTPPPNALSTVFNKGSSKTLVNTGEMQKTVQIVWKGKFKAFIGIPASAAKGMAKLADIHENGKVIIQQMTDRQRRFLHAKFSKGGGGKGGGGGGGTGIIVIHIPARPFMRPAFEEYKANAKDDILVSLTDNLSGWVASGH
mgnify:CR=1 FL=1